jgi:uncharacterized protein
MPATIVPRPLRLALSGATPRHWLAGEAALTHVFNSLSIVFPRGEKMFVDAVRDHRDHVHEPALKQAVRDFIGQEVNHSRAHVAFNDWLTTQGLPIAELLEVVESRIAHTEKLPAIRRLAVTCALEHFTAVLAAALLSHPTLLDEMHEDVRPLWLWHAIEEIEHKSVAFDVFEAAGGGYRMRAGTMVLVTFSFVYYVTQRYRELLRAEGLLSDRRARARAARKLFGPGGYLAGILPAYLAYYRQDFHPAQLDDSALLEAGRARLDALLAREEPGTLRRAS